MGVGVRLLGKWSGCRVTFTFVWSSGHFYARRAAMPAPVYPPRCSALPAELKAVEIQNSAFLTGLPPWGDVVRQEGARVYSTKTLSERMNEK